MNTFRGRESGGAGLGLLFLLIGIGAGLFAYGEVQKEGFNLQSQRQLFALLVSVLGMVLGLANVSSSKN